MGGRLPQLTLDPVDLQAKLFRGFADRSRLAILQALQVGPRNVGEIVAETGLSQPNVSNHLACLRECGLVAGQPQGKFVTYRIIDDRVGRILTLAFQLLSDVSSRIADCARYKE